MVFCHASELDDELPIDREVERLGELGVLGATDETKRIARGGKSGTPGSQRAKFL